MHWRTMHRREAPGNRHRVCHAVRRNGPHRHHHVAMQPPGRAAGAVGAVHRHVAPLLDMAHLDASFLQGRLESEAATDEEGDQIGVLLPQRPGVTHLLHQLAVAPDAVQRNIRAHIGPFGQQRAVVAGFNHVKHRARLGVALGIEQKVPGPFARQRNHVGLRHAGGNACCGLDLAFAVGLPGCTGLAQGGLQGWVLVGGWHWKSCE